MLEERSVRLLRKLSHSDTGTWCFTENFAVDLCAFSVPVVQTVSEVNKNTGSRFAPWAMQERPTLSLKNYCRHVFLSPSIAIRLYKTAALYSYCFPFIKSFTEALKLPSAAVITAFNFVHSPPYRSSVCPL